MEYEITNYEREKKTLDQQCLNLGELYLSYQSDDSAKSLIENMFTCLDLMYEYNMVEPINDKINRLLNFSENHYKKSRTTKAKELLAYTLGRAGDIKRHINFLTLTPSRDYASLYEKSFDLYTELYDANMSLEKAYRVGVCRSYLRCGTLRAFGNSLHYLLQAQMIAYDDSHSLTDEKALLQEIHFALASKYSESWAVDENLEMAKENCELVQSLSKELYGNNMPLINKRNFARNSFLYGTLLKKENNNQKAYQYYDIGARLYLEIYDKVPTPQSCFDWGMSCYNIAMFNEETIDFTFLEKAHTTFQKLVNDYPNIQRYKELYQRIKILRFPAHPPF